jgi:zinc transport system substrate-binding protein
LLLLVSSLVLLISCDRKAAPHSSGTVLAVSILPQQFFASRIGGDKVDVLVLVGPGQNPHSYEPTPRQMSDLSRAAAWILSGTEFEIALRPKIENLFPKLTVVDGTAGVVFRSLEEHEDEDEDDHDESGIDRHTWLGLQPAKLMAEHIRDTLCVMDSANAQSFRRNCDTLIAEMEKTFTELKRDLAPLKGKNIFVYHPAFGYFLDEFGIMQRAVETGGKEPTPRVLSTLIEDAKAEKIKTIFVQAQFPVESAKSVAGAAGAQVLALDPLAQDWLTNIKTMGEALKKAAAE